MNRRACIAVLLSIVILLILTIIMSPFPWSLDTSAEIAFVPDQDTALRLNSDNVGFVWQLTRELLTKEDERLRHIDTKANTLLGMLAVALSVVASVGTILMSQDVIKNAPRLFRVALTILWCATAVGLVTSFLFALYTTAVFTDPTVGGYHTIPPQAIMGPDRVGQDPIAFQRGLVVEGWEVMAKNVRENNRKALNLGRSQTLALYATIPLFGIVMLFGSALVSSQRKDVPRNCVGL